jgi:oxygen-independent coproporphyrinogen III oxidase
MGRMISLDQWPGSTDTASAAALQLPATTVPALYIHVPFCFHKCHYCDFYSITRQNEQRMAAFVGRVLREAEMWSAAGLPVIQPETLFFGGGTPTLLPLEQMRRLLGGLAHRLNLDHVLEWTVEANPATVSFDYCQMLRECGVNRISFGAQSFNRGELAKLERHHDPDDVPRSVQVARQAGFQRINVDLIYAIPGQDLASWDRSLEEAIRLNTEHISCYGLTYEPNTPIAVKKRLGQLVAVEDDLELAMLHRTRRRLAEVGFWPYEISNFARPGEACRHNLIYWRGQDYIGLGPSAASHVQGARWRNRPHLGEWEEAVERTLLPAIDVEHLSPRQRAGELAMLMLRLGEGIDFTTFADRTGSHLREMFSEVIKRLLDLGLIVVDSRSLRLSEAGINVADAVAAEFIAGCDG